MSKSSSHKLSDSITMPQTRKRSNKTIASIAFSLVIGAVVMLVATPYFISILTSSTNNEPISEIEIPKSGQVESEETEATEPAVVETAATAEEAVSESAPEPVAETVYYTNNENAQAQPAAEPAQPAELAEPVVNQGTNYDNPGADVDMGTSSNVDDPGAGNL